MYREPAPDVNSRYENWNDTIKYARKLIENAKDFDGLEKEETLKKAQNVLDGIPDAHPEKADLVKQIAYMR